MLSIGSDEIHLWLAFDREIRDAGLLAAYHRLLNSEERQQEQRFHFARDRQQYLVTRALTRSVLSYYAPVAPQDWRFRKLEHGRPQIINPQAGDLVFNLSHTAGLIVLGITRGGELGVDTENIIERSPPLEISRRYFSPRETGDLLALPQALQAERFFHYWTLKESYIKARSMGLALPLEQFSFLFPAENEIDIAFDPRLDDQPERWHFRLLRPTPEHLLAVCAAHAPASPPRRLSLRRIVPLTPPAAASAPLPAETLLLRQTQSESPASPANPANHAA